MQPATQQPATVQSQPAVQPVRTQSVQQQPQPKLGTIAAMDPMAILSKQDQYAKLRKDLKLLVSNIKFTNVKYNIISTQEVIDGEDYRNFGGNDVLKDLISTLRTSDRSVQK